MEGAVEIETPARCGLLIPACSESGIPASCSSSHDEFGNSGRNNTPTCPENGACPMLRRPQAYSRDSHIGCRTTLAVEVVGVALLNEEHRSVRHNALSFILVVGPSRRGYYSLKTG